jgi:pseudaminic acid synthase
MGTFIVAEISANHCNNLGIALDTMKAAKEAGADAVKIQTYTADSMTIDCDNENFIIKEGLWKGKKLYDLYSEASLPYEWHKVMFDYAKELGIVLFSSPFDIEAVDFLETFNCPIYKIASFEITNIPLIKYIASKRKPIFISTGIASKRMIIDALRSLGIYDLTKATLLKCTSEYPSCIKDANLLNMVEMKKEFNINVGLSDHTLGNTVAIAAATLGATVIEKHFILSSDYNSPDASFSMEPNEFKMMVEKIRAAEMALGSKEFNITEHMIKQRYFSKSIYITEDVKKGDIISKENIGVIRPGNGIEPKHYDFILGFKFKFNDNYKKGTPFYDDYIE